MRSLTNREAAWAWWNLRLAGEDVEIDPDRPECGLFKMRIERRWVPVQIDLIHEIDPASGDLLEDEGPFAWLRGARINVEHVWPRCAETPISPAEFTRLTNAPRVRDLAREAVV